MYVCVCVCVCVCVLNCFKYFLVYILKQSVSKIRQDKKRF